MGRKAGSRQLKREPSPGFWPLHRKEETGAPMTRPGPHAREKSLPLVLLLRDILGYAKTAHEAKRIIDSDHVRVDGAVRRDHRFPVALMDAVQIEWANKIFRALPKRGARLQLTTVTENQAEYKHCHAIGKSTVSQTR